MAAPLERPLEFLRREAVLAGVGNETRGPKTPKGTVSERSAGEVTDVVQMTTA